MNNFEAVKLYANQIGNIYGWNKFNTINAIISTKKFIGTNVAGAVSQVLEERNNKIK